MVLQSETCLTTKNEIETTKMTKSVKKLEFQPSIEGNPRDPQVREKAPMGRPG